MALQRLVDLNRHINTLEYLLQSNDNLVQAKLFDADGLSKSRKRSRKLQRHILGLKQEAEYLTDFMIGYLSLVVDDQLPVSTNCHPTAHFLDASDKWDLVVSTINKKLLPVALWWILCQNIDIWCSHAATKKLKKFLSLLLRTSIPCVSSSSYMVGNHKMGETRKKKITVHQISSELLCDSILYEHKFVRRNLASRFCHILEESVLQLFDDFSTEDINFISSPNWPEVLSALNKLSVVVSGRKQVAHDSVKKSHSLSSSQLPTEICKEQGASGLTRMKFTACQNLLNLLCRMPKGYLNLKSFRIIATHILNLERVVIDSLLRCQATLSSHQQHELFRLFVSCRRTLKCVIMASCEEITGDILSSLLPIVPEGSSLVLWLFKSVYTVVGLQGALLEDSITESRHMIFSLMDNTSYVFLTISKYQFSRALHLFIAAKEPSKEQHSPSFSGEQKTSNEYDLCSDSSKGIEDCRNVLLAAESLKEQMQCLQITLKDAFRNDNARGVNVVSLNKLSSILSCLGGFLWGLSSAMNQIDPKKNVQKTFRWTCEPLSKLNICMDVFSDFVSVFLQLLFVEDDGRSRGLSNDKSSQKDFECSRDSGDVQSQNLGAVRAATASSNLDDGATRNSSLLEDIDSSVNVMTEVELGELQCLNKHFMHSLLKGDHPEAAYSLRQLLIVSSATLRFNLYMNGTPLSSSLVSIVVGISQVLLSGLVDMVEAPEPFSFVWLDGVLKYLEELGSHFPLTSHTLTRNVYSELIELHLRAIGKCISLQGKRATLASHETESSNKMFHGDIGLSEPSLSYGAYCLDEFKTRLRMSFKVFVEKSSELHLLSAIQAIERALVGVWEGCTTVYGIKTGNADGGKVSSTVGAGIDCLDLILEYVSGRKRLNVVKRHIQSLVAALFNVILHLRSPSIFYTESVSNKGGDYPDPGSVILMCIEVLTRVSGKHVLFQMDSWHIGQSIHIPAAIFCDLHQLITSGAAIAYNTSMFSDNQQHGHVTSMNYLVVDRQFSITLFAACCRLLYTVLKHHKSESEQCLAVLEESVSALLHSLETVDDDSVLRKGCFSWELEEGVKCACFLRRIYEELRQQKDVFGRHCFKFLSTYIWVYSGYGPLKMGIRREIDEALKPGVYALIDACSADDLQYLHTVFGEGPCRNNLATLQHDYKLNFQYGGKV